MGELTNNILDIYKYTPERTYFGVSSISSCPRETYLNYVIFLHKEKDKKKRDLEFLMLLDDGHYQEAEIISLLKRAFYNLEYTGKNQATIHIGRSNIPGHPDGIIKGTIVEDFTSPRMLEIKARNYLAFTKFKELGISGFPKIEVQIQLYMSAEDLPYEVEECHLIFKHKESTKLEDIKVHKNVEFAARITKETDSIIVDGEVPDPVKCNLCNTCRFYNSCWKQPSPVVDFSGLQFSSLSEASEQWAKGKSYQNLGKVMVEEAMEAFEANIEDDTEEMITDLLKIKRVSFRKRQFSKDLFIEKYGEDAFNEVCEFPKVEYLRPSIL